MLGCAGSGKSTLSRRLARCFSLPVIHLDQLYFGPGWQPVSSHQFAERIRQSANGEGWVMDGNYLNFLPLRLGRATHVVFLDLPRWQCLLSVLWRWWCGRGKVRTDAAAGCPEKIDRAFLAWIWGYPRRSRPGVLRALEAARQRGCQVWRVSSRRELARLWESWTLQAP